MLRCAWESPCSSGSDEYLQQPSWGRSREFEITTRSVNRNGITQSTTGDLEEEEEEDDSLVHGRRKRKVAFMPSLGE